MESPLWLDEFRNKYQQGISHAFILHHNVNDYAVPGGIFKDYLIRSLASRQIVVIYNRAEGLVFPLESHRKKFIEVLGLGTPQGQAEADAAGLSADGTTPHRSDPRVTLRLLTRLLRMGSPSKYDESGNLNDDWQLASVIFDYAESLFGQSDDPIDKTNLVLAQGWGSDPNIMGSGNIIFMMTSDISQIHPSLRQASSRWESIAVPLPDQKSRIEYIDWYQERTPINTELTSYQIANSTAFLQLIHIEDIFLRAAEEGSLTIEMIKERKREIIATEFSDVLEIWEPEEGFSTIGGLDVVKDFFKVNVISPMREGNLKRVPKGIMMMGPAGTGKSVMAESVAFEAGVNSGQLNMAKIFSKWVGDTERNLEKIIQAMISLAPFICFIDEIDQSIQRGDGESSGVSSRVFKRLLEVMADESLRGKIVFLVATNRPDLIDPALKRAGRMDQKIAFFIPTAPERTAILDVMIKKYMTSDGVSIPSYVIDETIGWTGAELVELARKAKTLIDDKGMDPEEALTAAVDRLCPTTQDIEKMTALAMAEINDLDLVPDDYKEQWISIRKRRPQAEEAQKEVTRGRGRREI